MHLRTKRMILRDFTSEDLDGLHAVLEEDYFALKTGAESEE